MKISKSSIKHFVGERRFWHEALRLAMPIALQNLLVSSFTLVDTLMVGQLGDLSLSAVGMAGQWAWLFNMFLFGLCSGGSVIFAQLWGIKDRDGIRRTASIVTVLASCFCAVFFLSALLLPEGVMRIFNKNPDVIKAGTEYIKIALFSYPAVMASNIFSALLRSTENVKLPLITSAFSTVFNAVFNYGLIFGRFGMPEMGIRGAALATVISAWAGFILLVLLSVFQKNILVEHVSSYLHVTREDFKVFVKTAMPVVFNEGAWGLGTMLYNIIFSNLGYEYYAAVTINKTFENIAFVFFVGFCNACCVMVGKRVGAGEIERAKLDARRFAVIEPLMAVFVGIFIIIFRSNLVQIFNMGNAISDLTLKTATGIMLIYGLHLPMRMLPYIQIVGIFRSGGDTVNGAKFDMLTLWLIALPVTYITAYVIKLPFVAVYALMFVCEDYPKNVMCLRHLLSDKWLKPITKEGQATMTAEAE